MIRPLDVFERALLISDHYSPFSPVTVVQIEPCLPPHIVGQAVDWLQSNHALLRACIVEGKGAPYFDLMPVIKTSYQALVRRDETHWQEVVQEELAKRLDIHSGPLFTCNYLYSEAGQAGIGEIILKFHHSIVDGSVIHYLFDELLKLCACVQSGQQIAAVSDAPIPPALESTFPPRYKGLGRFWRSMVYALTQMWDEIDYRWRVRAKRKPAVKGFSSLHPLILDIPQDLGEALTRRAHREGVTLPNLLNATLLLAVNRQLYQGVRLPMRTFVFADLRPYTIPPTPLNHLGCVISMLRYTVDVDPDWSIWQQAVELQTRVVRSFRRGEKFTANLFSASLMTMFTKLKNMRMASTALSYSSLPDLPVYSNGVSVRSVVGFASNIDLGPEFTATVVAYEGQMKWGITFFENDLTPAQGQALVLEVRRLLEMGV